ncbi:MAG: response regulator [Nitrospinota bacterium]
MAKRLLVADGSPTIQREVEVTFQGRDIEVLVASDGETALRLARELGPDVVLADVEMPDLDGLSLCRTMKSDPLLKGIPCILLTKAFGEPDEASARAAGAASWLAKPFEAKELVAKVERALGEPEAGATPPPPASQEPLSASVEPVMEDFALEERAGGDSRPRDVLPGEADLDTEVVLEEAERLIEEEERREKHPALEASPGVALSPAGGGDLQGGPSGEGAPEALDLADLLEIELARGEEEKPEEFSPPPEAAPAERPVAPEPAEGKGGDDTPVAEEAPRAPRAGFRGGAMVLSLPEAELRSLAREVLSEGFEKVVPRVVQLVEETAREMAPAIVERVVREEIERLKRGE